MKNWYIFYQLIGGILLSAIYSESFAQRLASPLYWNAIDESSIFIQGSRPIIPNVYAIQHLNFESLKQLLNQAPLEFTDGCWEAAVLIELPMPNGTFQQFRIVESPIVEPDLAKKFPEIKTFLGQGITDPAAKVRMDISHKGFHAMIYHPEGAIFIDPYNTKTTSEYIIYHKKDARRTEPFTCGIEASPTLKIPPVHEGAQPPAPDKQVNSAEFQLGDCKLRTYRLALAATGEYTTYHGGLVQDALAAQIVTINRVNGIYETDLGIRMILIANNNLIIYTNGTTDPYTNNDGIAMLSQNQSTLNSVIGSANYDIGHVFSTGGGGIAQLQSPCSSTKAWGVTGLPVPTGSGFDIDYVAHEMGHQFGANHTQNNDCEREPTASFEPGSASTIMGYAGICAPNVQNFSDPYFHSHSINEIKTFIADVGNTCATAPAYANAAPVIQTFTASQTIPKGTPFFLTATATDANGDALTYCWEQMDKQVSTQPPEATATNGPNFRSFTPTISPVRYFPRLAQLVGTPPATNWEVIPTVARTLNFRLVVRDNAPGGGCNAHQNIAITVSGTTGPFVVTIPDATGISWAGGSTQTVTWNTAGTSGTPVNCANADILLSTDGGLTYPVTLATGVTNSGSASVTIPNTPTTTARIMVRGSGRAFFDISNNNFTITSATCTAPAINAPTLTQPTCAVTTGTIVVNPAAAGVEYSVNNGSTWQSSNSFPGLVPGAYNIRVRTTGSTTCYRIYASNPVIINAVPLAPIVTTPTVTQPTCTTATGTIRISTNAGSESLQCSINNGSNWFNTRTFSGLAPGSYNIKVRLAASPTCITTYSGNPVVIDPAPSMSACAPQISAKVFLEGPYSTTTLKMSDNLRTAGVIPLTEPFTTLLFTHVNGGGGETIAPSLLTVADSNAITDWIFVELRDKNNPVTTLHTRSALVQKDGDIVDIDGISPLKFSQAVPDNYYVAIRHRNHFGFRTANTYSLSATPTPLNFTNTTTPIALYGTNALKTIGNIRAMYSGDANRDGAINAVDRNAQWRPQNGGTFNYLNTNADFNLDATINAVDRNAHWRLNNSLVQQLD